MRGIGSLAGAATRALVRRVFPGHCAFCGVAAADEPVCPACLGDLPRIGAACERCALPLPLAMPPGVPCGGCQATPPPFRAARSALHYRFPVDAALKGLKFRRQLHYVPAFASLLLPVAKEAFGYVDALVPVPLHRLRHAVRGFNQARELAKPVARTLGLPLVDVLRVRRTRPQTGLSARERRRNLARAFAVSRALRYRHPLIIDDVMTTGETCRHLALALLRAGAESVSVLTVARAAPEPNHPATGRKV